LNKVSEAQPDDDSSLINLPDEKRRFLFNNNTVHGGERNDYSPPSFETKSLMKNDVFYSTTSQSMGARGKTILHLP